MAADTSAFSLLGNETPEMVLERLKKEQHAALISTLQKASSGTAKQQQGTAIGAALGLALRKAFGGKPEDDPAYQRAVQNEDVAKAFSETAAAAAQQGATAQPLDVADQNQLNGEVNDAVGYPAKPVEQQVADHAKATAGSGSLDGVRSMIEGYDAAIQKASALGRPDIARKLVMERTTLAADYEEKQANLAKLRVSTEKDRQDINESKAKVTEMEAGGKPAEYEQLVLRNEALRTRLQNVPAGSAAYESIQRMIKENEGRMEKLNTVVGRTDNDIGKPTQTALEKEVVQHTKTIDNLRAIQDSFKPEYLKYGEQVKQFGVTQGSKLGIPLAPETLQANDDYREFQREGSKLLNDTIRDVTGATVGNTQESLLQPSEAGRIRASVPNDSDGPTNYSRKYNTVYWMTQAAQARALDALKQNNMQVLRKPLKEYAGSVDTSGFIGNFEIPGVKAKPATEAAPTPQVNDPAKQSIVDQILGASAG